MPFHPPYEQDGNDGYICPRKHHSGHPYKTIFKLKHLNNVGINTSLCPLSPNRHRSFSKESALLEKRHIGLKERNNIL